MSNIRSITKKKIQNETLWNLAVERDESYIANDIVVHNCRSTLIPITKYEEFKPTESIRGEDPQKFIEANIGTGFSKYTNEPENKIIIKQKQPSIDDDGVEIESTYKDNCETIKYSLNGIVFQETNIIYEDDKRDKIKSLKHKKINNE